MQHVRVRGIHIAASLLMSLVAISATRSDELSPPLLQIGQIDPVTVDGRITEGEWDEATELGVFVGEDGLPSNVPVRARIGWDADGLAVLWEVTGDPEFRRRDRDSEVWRDDAVEVRLQAGENGPVQRLAINAGGSIFDAQGGDASWNPAWRALALRGTEGWHVEMHIPFAALGARADEALRANLIVNDAEINAAIAAWTFPDDRAEDDFGFLRLAEARSPVTLQDIRIEGDSATLVPLFDGAASLRATLFEGNTEVQTAEASEAGPLEITLPRPGRFRLRLAGTGADGELVLQREFPLLRIPPLALTARKRLLTDRAIDLTIDGTGLSADPDTYVLSATGAPTVAVAPGSDRLARGTLDLSECASGELTVTVTAMADGRQLATETLTFVLPPRPDWAGGTRGRHGRLMEPWTPVQVEGNRVHCWDRVYDFGEGLLPSSIRSGRDELLAGRVVLRAKAGSATRDWDEATVRWLETTDTHATVALTADSALAEARVQANCDYDGLMTFNVKIDPLGERPLSEVSLEIPVAAEFATHLQIADGTAEGFVVTDARRELTREFAPMVWLTGRERGLQWVCASEAGWSLEDPSRALQIIPGRERTTLVVTMLDRELLPGEAFEASFALQATPTRPVPADWREWQTVTLHSLPVADEAAEALLAQMREHQVRTIVLDDETCRPRPGGLGEQGDAALAEFARLCHEAGLRLILVIDDDLTRDPVWEAFRDEVASAPIAEGGPVRPCPGSAWADYVVEAAAYAMEHYDADGIHLSGGASLQTCGVHIEGEGACAVMGARDLMMRLRTVVHEGKPGALLTAEFADGVPAPAAAFADGLVLANADAEDEPLSVDEFIARGGRRAMGPAVEVGWPQTTPVEQINEAVGLALLHDVGLRPAAIGEGLATVSDVRSALQEFDLTTARWRPWWAKRALVTADPADVLASTWWRHGEVLATVSNRGSNAAVVELSFDRNLLELGPWLWAVDVLGGQRIPQIGDVLRFRMESGETALIHIRTRHERDVEIDE